MAGIACPTCARSVDSLPHHFARHPECNPIKAERAPPPRAASSTAGEGAASHFKTRFERKVNIDYANLRYKCFVDTSHIGQFHSCAVGWMGAFSEEAIDAMSAAKTLSEAIRNFKAVVDVAESVMKKYQSQAQRDAYLINTVKVPFIKPSAYNPGQPYEFRKHAAKLSLSQTLGRILQNDKAAREAIIAKSEEWKTGALHCVRATQLVDIADGWRCRSHPHLMRTATPEEVKRRVIRVGLGIHNDDVTLVNGIGTKKGEHKESVTSADFLNLPANMRKSHEYKVLLSIVNSKFLKCRGGMEWSICGVDEHGKETVTDSLAAELRQCSFSMELPDDQSLTGFSNFPVEVYFILAYTDWLANAALGYTPELTQSEHPCGDCLWVSKAAQKRQRGATAPRTLSGKSFERRSHEKMKATAQRLKKANLSKTELEKQMKAAGISKLTCVLDEDRIPGADSVLSKPPDVMHLYGAGLTRIEACHCNEIMFKKPALLAVSDPWKKLNENIEKLNRSLPRGKRLPKLYPQVYGEHPAMCTTQRAVRCAARRLRAPRRAQRRGPVAVTSRVQDLADPLSPLLPPPSSPFPPLTLCLLPCLPSPPHISAQGQEAQRAASGPQCFRDAPLRHALHHHLRGRALRGRKAAPVLAELDGALRCREALPSARLRRARRRRSRVPH